MSTMEKFSLKWNDFQTTVSNSFKLLRREKDLFDVTLVSDDHEQIQSHKVVLSACSSFFKPILKNNSHSHPLIFLNGIDSTNLQFIIDYVYEGEVHLYQEQLNSFLETAKKLQLAGLLTNLKEKTENEDSRIEETKFYDQHEEEEEQKSGEIGEKSSQSYTRTNRMEVATNSHDQTEVNRQINEMMVKEGNYFKCTVCGKVAKDSSHMKRHIELHIEGLSYECSICNNTFRNKKSLYNHKFKNHRGL